MPKLIARNLTGDQFSDLKDFKDPNDENPKLKLTNVVDLSDFKSVDPEKQQNQVRGFYEKQNALIILFKQHLGSVSGPVDMEMPNIDEEEEEEDVSNSMIQSAIILSFLSNVVLLILKMWMAIVTGSMAIIASAADSLLDLVSGVVLLVADRMANKNVDFYKYPEGRSRVEPIGIIIFATVMCLSSLNILIECLKRIIDGLFGHPLEIEIGIMGFVVLGSTIVVKFALWVWCQIVLKSVGSSPSIEAYAQDHLNDVMTNATAVGCVLLATQLKGWWIADPLGAAIISIW
eukprot:CAMPEP_0114361108 /NCGR_PEP_ID=MMETSP0101-20121206/24423_1 /TAXON_ID=38822 ORGANISM="Pteridomonas danica, Strain PT" /NCGR_SAMPLE_ID=MMETSP0101 /ASSEMBLY_ACC=CAM_ASM_000211 /LENGTH=288 /DNA_ID=CAMNT_0001505793 /DNA_START=202 /DNA_END=1065 /DNA_ORIENTATION=+